MPNIVRNRPGLQRPQVSSGQRRVKIELRSSTTTVDVLGGLPQGNYSAFGNDWAELSEIPFIVSSTEHGMLYQFVIRYRADIISEFETQKKRVRVVDGVREYQVLEIENPEQRNIELKLHCAPAEAVVG